MAVSFLRTIILYLFVVLALRLTGKRQIGELSPTELVVTILISELAAIPMQDLGIPLLHGIIPILTIISAEMLLSLLSLKSAKARRLFSGKSTIFIRNGVLDQKVIKDMKLSIDELVEELRQKGIFRIEDVDYAIMETNGKISVLLKQTELPVTARMLNIQTDNKIMPVPIIMDGKLLKDNLGIYNITESDISNNLKENSIDSVKNVLYMYAYSKDSIFTIRKEI